jgi:uncharacterized membrane protein
MLLRAFFVWLSFVLLAVLNGAFRETVLVPRFGATLAGQLSATLLATAILGVTYLTVTWIAPATTRDAWLVGAAWLVLVLLFEFGLGRAQGTTWSAMLQEYHFWKGKLWVLVLAATSAAPFIAGRLRHLL